MHTVNNLACLAWAQQLGLPSFLGPGHTVVDFGCGFELLLLLECGFELLCIPVTRVSDMMVFD